MTKDEALDKALDWYDSGHEDREEFQAMIENLLAAPVQEPVAYRQTGWAAHRDQYAVPVLFNPYNGQPRDVRDVQSDPQGILIVPPGKVEMLAAKPTGKQSLQVEQLLNDMLDTLPYNSPEYWMGRIKEVLPINTTPPAAQRQWVGLTDDEMYLNCPNWLSHEQCKTWVQQIEAKLKEKNT